MDIQELLAKAFDICNKTSYTVNFFIGKQVVDTKEMTYTELGIYLINNNEKIICIDITE